MARNDYAYALNNPVNFTDPMGLDVSDRISAIGNFLNHFKEMERANTIRADKFFHCKANCEAARCGDDGCDMAEKISNLREAVDCNLPKRKNN